MDEVTAAFRVVGRVQGVGFRAWAAGHASRHGLGGWVRNCRDGSVEVAVAGPAPAVERFRELLGQCPPHARVVGVEPLELTESPSGGHFEIRRGV